MQGPIPVAEGLDLAAYLRVGAVDLRPPEPCDGVLLREGEPPLVGHRVALLLDLHEDRVLRRVRVLPDPQLLLVLRPPDGAGGEEVVVRVVVDVPDGALAVCVGRRPARDGVPDALHLTLVEDVLDLVPAEHALVVHGITAPCSRSWRARGTPRGSRSCSGSRRSSPSRRSSGRA